MKAQLTSADAQVYWMSARIPNDQFLLYAFDGSPADIEVAVDEVVRRARGCPDLAVRVRDECALTYPSWIPAEVTARQVVVHADGLGSETCLESVARLAESQLDLRRHAWRLHVFPAVSGVPRVEASSSVVVVQIGHALADGLRCSALAAHLFGRAAAVPPLVTRTRGCLLTRSLGAARTHRQLERDTAAGLVPQGAVPKPVRSINTRPGQVRTVRTLVRTREELGAQTVSVAVLVAVSTALAGYLRARGEDVSVLGAEVPMAKAGERSANNHFRNVAVNLYPDRTEASRAEAIRAELAERRRRGSHPALLAGDRASAAVPAPLLRWGVKHFDVDARSPVVTGNTVVSSVNRGPADLSFGGRPVALTAGYPGLSPMMGLTHGAHGIGDTVAISVHAAASAVADLDEYLDRLDAALG